ncbi:hypothetical protein [Streptomyces sp. NPDC002520]
MSDIPAGLPYINSGSGKLNHEVSVYAATVPLHAGETVFYVTLCNVDQSAAASQTSKHIFDTAIG